jgi:tetratricopeptide (TPR) repeat protein
LNLRFNTAVPTPNVSARLTHEPSGKIVWARSFDLANRADPTVPAETDIARQIATSVGQPYGVLFADLRQRPSLDTRTRCIVQAYDYWNNPSAESHARVRDCLEGVVTAQPSAATALANLSYFYLDEHRIGHNVRPNPLDRALTAARRAVEIAPESPRTNQALMAVLFVRGDVDQALQLGRRALELNPYDTDIMADVGSRFVQMGRYQEGADLIRRAAAANPADPPWYDFFLFLAAYMQNDWEAARAAASRITTSDYVLGLIARAIVAAQDGDAVKAREALARVTQSQPEYGRDPASALARRRFVPEIHRRLLHGLEQAGLRS